MTYPRALHPMHQQRPLNQNPQTVNLGYVSLEDKEEFIKPAFSDSKVLV
jgi:hypothetical protein